MFDQRLKFASSRKKTVFQILFINFIILIIAFFVAYFIIEPLTTPKKMDNPLVAFGDLIIILFVISVLIGIITINTYLLARYYQTKYSSSPPQEIFQSTEIQFLESIRHKVIIGLDNIKNEYLEPYVISEPLPLESGSFGVYDYFPSEIQTEIQTLMKSKTIFTLIEVAYQDPRATNPVNIAKSLNIPLSSLSREIKKLIDLNYLEKSITEAVIKDARLRNYKITPKGYYFLSQLNSALKTTIERLKIRQTKKLPLIEETL